MGDNLTYSREQNLPINTSVAKHISMDKRLKHPYTIPDSPPNRPPESPPKSPPEKAKETTKKSFHRKCNAFAVFKHNWAKLNGHKYKEHLCLTKS
jgi:hypothetical protein